MAFKQDLKRLLENGETSTVSDSFGGTKIEGKAPSFKVSLITNFILDYINGAENHLVVFPPEINTLNTALTQSEFSYLINCLVRFSYLIELTNLGITSTKMKTRWYPGHIIKTQVGTYQNYRGEFSPGNDQRSSSYDECFDIMIRSIQLLASSSDHIDTFKNLCKKNNRGYSYESVFEYINPNINPVHISQNIRLVHLTDINWLVQTRPIIRTCLTSKNRGKIATKSYKTDRSQTGEVQTNRAKRWECLSEDFQHATVENCWSVERKLLNDLVFFEGFTQGVKDILVEQDLIEDTAEITKCPITYFDLRFEEFQRDAIHGESNIQVGHLIPLKAGGHHIGDNIAWISYDGNRIQGHYTLQETQNLLKDIQVKYVENNV